MEADEFRCQTCERTVGADEVIRRETLADLDPDTWQTVCCPACGRRLKTVHVGDR